MANPKVFLVLGKSGSGKSTFVDSVINDKDICDRLKLKRLIRYTDRERRHNEDNGVEYEFLTRHGFDEELKKRDKNNIVLSTFNSYDETVRYLTDLSELQEDTNYIVTGDPSQIDTFKNILGKDLCVIFIEIDYVNQYRRLKSRIRTALDRKEVKRRMKSDSDLFSGVMASTAKDTSVIIISNSRKNQTEDIYYTMDAFIKIPEGFTLLRDISCSDRIRYR